MDFKLTEEQENFRQEVRDFLKDQIERGSFKSVLNGVYEGNSQDFSKKLAAKGWIGMIWPKEYGGQGRAYVDRLILLEELFRVQAPFAFHFVADRQMGPALIRYGSESQKEAFLPKIIKADISFCLLISEPDAGSDVASIKTKAEDKGDYYLVNGQKIWSSGSDWSSYGWLLAKTNLDPKVSNHKSLSEFIVDLKSPGIIVRSIPNMVGAHSLNEVFFEDVNVPKENLVGEKDKGFPQIMTQMGYERGGLERLMMNYPVYELILKYVKTTKKNGILMSEDPVVRKTLAQLEIEFNVGRLLCYHVAWTLDQGKIPTYEAALCKVFCTQYEQRLGDTATRLMGPYGQLLPGCKRAPFDGWICQYYLWNPAFTIQGGSVEILKDIIALRGLGLQVK